jgi:hypothetical protein
MPAMADARRLPLPSPPDVPKKRDTPLPQGLLLESNRTYLTTSLRGQTMEDQAFRRLVIQNLGIQAPIILASLAGLIVAIQFRRKALAASRWAVGAFVLSLATSGHIIYAYMTESVFQYYMVVPTLRGITYLLLLAAVYCGRKDQSVSEDSAQSILGPIREVFRARPGLKTVFITIFASVYMLSVIITTLFTFVQPSTFSSIAELRLQGDDSRIFYPNFLNTECAVIESDLVLSKVVQTLDLGSRWARKFGGGGRLNTTECAQILKSHLSVTPRRGTSVLEISMLSDDPREAAELANAVARAAQELYEKGWRDMPNNGSVHYAEIMRPAIINRDPVRPKKALMIAGSFWFGAWLALIVATCVTWLGFKFKPPATPITSPMPDPVHA